MSSATTTWSRTAVVFGVGIAVLQFGLFSFTALGLTTPQRTPENGMDKESFKDLEGKSRADCSPHPLAGMVRSYPNSVQHDPTKRRNCFAFTAVPKEMNDLVQQVTRLLNFDRYMQGVDCIHLSIPDRPLRFSKEKFPTTRELQRRMSDPRIVLHRLPDYGPLTRYIGPLAYEKHPDTAMVVYDVDSLEVFRPSLDQAMLFMAARELDENAMWCLFGENFQIDDKNRVSPAWDTFGDQMSKGYVWNEAHFARAAEGLLFKPKHFRDFWFNQSEYHESCFWDDDRWVGFQMARQGFPIKRIHMMDHYVDIKHLQPEQRHRRLGTLTEITERLNSASTCTSAWMKKHPDAYPTARGGN